MSDSTNNVRRLLALDKNSGKLEYDERGFIKFIPTDDEKARIESWLRQEISQAQDAYQQRFAESLENVRAYKARKEYIDGEEAKMPIPLTAIAADQVISSTYNQLVRPRPIVSIDAYFPEQYSVAVPVPVEQPMMDEMGGPMMGPDGMPMMQTVTTGVPLEKDSEEIARHIEQGLEFKNRERLNLPKIIQEVVTDVVTDGALPAYMKVCADRSVRTIIGPKVNGISIDLDDKAEYQIASKQITQIYTVPKTNILKPIDEDDVNASDWFLEWTPIDPEIFDGRVRSGEYFLIDEKDTDKLSSVVGDAVPETEREKRSSTQSRHNPTPKNKIALAEVYLSRWVKYKDPQTGEKKLKKLNLVGDWHHGAGKLCNLYLNWYEHQERPYVPCWQIKDTHSDSGVSTVDRVKWHQHVMTHAAQAEIKNAWHANNLAYWYDPDSRAADFFSPGGKLRAGEAIPAKGGVGTDAEWGVVRAGADHSSMLPFMQYIEGQASRVSNVSAYEQGEAVPGRTPSSTVAQILQQGQQQPLMFLRTLNDSFTKAIRLFLKTERQFQPFGETIPIRNPETKAIIEIPFRYPMAEDGIDPLDNFRISLTAADEALAKEHDEQAVMMNLQAWQGYANFVAQVAGPLIANPQATPGLVDLGTRIIAAGEVLITKLMGMTRTDEDKFKVMPAIDLLKQEKMQAQQAMQQQQMGGMNAGSPASGGSVPGPVPGEPGAGQGMAGAPGDASPAGPMEAQGAPVVPN